MTPRFSSFPCMGCATDPELSRFAFSLHVVKESTVGPILNLVDIEPYNGKTYALVYSFSEYTGTCYDEEDCHPTFCVHPVQFKDTCGVEIHTPNGPVPAVQPGTRVTLDTGDNRILSASSGPFETMWFAYNEGCANSRNSCFHLVQLHREVHTVAGSTQMSYILKQDFEVSSAPNDAFYPALDIDNAGNMALIFGLSGSSQFPSLAVSRQDRDGTPNAIQTPATAVSGTSSDTRNSAGATGRICNPCARYGDYFEVAADPVELIWWLAGEYMTVNTTGGSSTPIYSTLIVDFFVRP
jgi:hypothetical protein